MQLKLGRFARIDVFLHWTFVFLPIYLIYRCRWQSQMPWAAVAVLMALVGILFVCVVMHEFGHALMARKLGIGTHDIIITPIGGLARLDRMSANPKHELLIALAGPLVNLVIAAILALVLAILGTGWEVETTLGWTQVVGILMWMNLALFLFNLIPAFPMDGGRVLRSCLAMFLPHRKATRIAGHLGQLLAILFVIYAIVTNQLLLAVVGVFVFYAARVEMKFSGRATRSEPFSS